MGNKNRLLDCIIPEIEKITNQGDTVCDMMAGTNVIGYALKNRNRIISNDIQHYSYIIGKALVENNDCDVNAEQAAKELTCYYEDNMGNSHFTFFRDNYSDTYFSRKQCIDIDSIRYAIENVRNDYIKSLYLCSLMNVMCKVQSTPGHFAQFMPKDHPRIISLREMDVWKLFLEKCNDFCNIVKNNYKNKAYNLDYRELFNKDIINEVKCFYLDSPYTTEQYSRFYHVLETVTKYDSPELTHKALYRVDRYKSKFCYKSDVKQEFEYIMKFIAERGARLVISYSNKGVVSIEELKKLANEYFTKIKVVDIDYAHSTQGKGSKSIKEYIFVLSD